MTFRDILLVRSIKTKTVHYKRTLTPALSRLRAVLSAVALIALISGAAIAHADQYDAQINSLKAQNNNVQAQVNSLVQQAGSYQAAIDQLSAQIGALQSALTTNETKQADLQQQITNNQNKINQKKQYLGDDIKAMYVDGQLTTIEELATSNSLSDYVDKEEYRTGVQNKIDSQIKEINALQVQLQKQKTELDALVKSQQDQNAQLGAVQSQQQQMLAYNQDQQNAFNAQIAANSSKIAQLRQQQLAANRRLDSSGQIVTSGSCGGGYPAVASGGRPGPWGCNVVHTSDFVPGCSYYDSWGMCNRECVSYTAWMVYKTYGISTAGYGNASQWPGNSRYPVGYTPKVGSVAIAGAGGGGYGHAMWVVGVSGNQIHVYSYNDNYDGNFYDHWVNASGLTYIYFGG